MKKYKHCLLGFLVINSSMLFAGTMGNSVVSYHPFVTLGVGAAWQQIGHTQFVELLPPDGNFYIGQSHNSVIPMYNLAVGTEQQYNKQLFYQLGIAVNAVTNNNTGGQVWQLGLPEFNNLTYNYQVQSTSAVLTGKLLSTYHLVIHPYVSANIGAGINRVFNYYETPLIPEAIAMAPFQNHTQTSLAWGVGTGLDIDITNSVRLGLGYQFSDFGKYSLKNSPDQLTTYALNKNQLYTQQLLLQLTYIR